MPFRYLAFSLSAKRLSIHDCLPIVNKITARIKHWTSRNLSIAGRVPLVNSVIHAMHSYWAQIFLLLCKIISMVEQICNKFIWYIDDQSGAKPRVAWKQVCKPKAYGGLSICNIKAWNDVVLLKSLWVLASKKHRLWIKWVNDYYLKGTHIMQFRVSSTAYWMLNRIVNSREQIDSWNELGNFVVNEKFNTKVAYLSRVATGPKPSWRLLWSNNRAPPRSVICL